MEAILPEMVKIPAGEFIYGASPDVQRGQPHHRWDLPQEIVYCATFSIAIHETSMREFARFIQDGGYENDDYWPTREIREQAMAHIELSDKFYNETKAIGGISYYEANAYCKWLSQKTGEPYRLPTEIEWEKAARGTDGRIYPWGNEWKPWVCNWNDDADRDSEPNGKVDGFRLAAEIGSYPEGRSPYGCHDMAGNLWEWCDAWLIDTVGRRYRVYRGGSYWSYYPRHLQSTFRGGSLPEVDMVFQTLSGFRIARSEHEGK